VAAARGFMFAFLSHNPPEGETPASLFVTPVGNLQTASAFPLDHNFAVKRAQLDLPNVTASNIGLFGDKGGALQAAAGLALRNVFAAVNEDRCRCGIEVRLEHEPTMRLGDERFKALRGVGIAGPSGAVAVPQGVPPFLFFLKELIARHQR
jgi:hypothetical protein